MRATGLEWLEQGRRTVAAVLVETLGSAPFEPGATMLVGADGAIEGSVTGGCVEAALFDEAQAVLRGGPPRVVTYGISDEEAADVGLMCGGTVRVFVHELGDAAQEALAEVSRAAAAGEPAALATLLDGPRAGATVAVLEDDAVGSFGLGEAFDHAAARDARGLLAQGVTTLRRYGADGATLGAELRVHVTSFATPPAMVIFGAIDFSLAVATMARELGYAVTICDARRQFLGNPRFARVAEVVVDWPDRHLAGRRLGPRDVVLVFTHDPKFDEPALVAALASGAGYVGALGSRRTQALRRERLRAAGVEEHDLDRIQAPCGLDIGARTPAETAVSVLAEIIARRAGRGGSPLSETSGPIHDPREAPAPAGGAQR